MNDSLGNTMLLSIVLFIVSAVMLLFVGALAYSKAFKAKNIIINYIENHEDYSSAKEDIYDSLTVLGYQIDNDFRCPDDGSNKAIARGNNFKYCIYQKPDDLAKRKEKNPDYNGGYYYKVVTYTQFKFPIIGDIISTKVSGETKKLGKKYNYD